MTRFQLPQSVNQLEDFPNDFLIHILEHIKDFQDYMQIRLLNRRWMQLVDNLNLQGLCFRLKTNQIENFHLKPKCFQGNYFFTNQCINHDTYFEVTSAQSICDLFTNEYRYLVLGSLRNVNRLYFNCLTIVTQVQLQNFENFLNDCSNLEQIEFDYLIINLTDKYKVVQLNLKRIKIFSVVIYKGNNMILSAPLVKLCYHTNFRLIEIVNKANVTHLHLNAFDPSLSTYRNVEYVHFKNLNAEATNPNNAIQIVSCFPNIKEINFENINRDLAEEILRQKRVQRNLNFSLYIADVLINTWRDLDQLYDGESIQLGHINLNRILNFIDRLRPVVTCITNIDYCVLPQDRPNFDIHFFRRFINIRTIIFGDGAVYYWNDAVHLIKNCNVLQILIFRKSRPIQQHYSDLPAYAPYLTEFEIDFHYVLQPNIDFVRRFKHLQKFTIRNFRVFTHQIFGHIVLGLPYLKVLKFDFLDNKRIEINLEEYHFKVIEQTGIEMIFMLNIVHLEFDDPSKDEAQKKAEFWRELAPVFEYGFSITTNSFHKLES